MVYYTCVHELLFTELFISYEMELWFSELFKSYETQVETHVHEQIEKKLGFHELQTAFYH